MFQLLWIIALLFMWIFLRNFEGYSPRMLIKNIIENRLVQIYVILRLADRIASTCRVRLYSDSVFSTDISTQWCLTLHSALVCETSWAKLFLFQFFYRYFAVVFQFFGKPRIFAQYLLLVFLYCVLEYFCYTNLLFSFHFEV